MAAGGTNIQAREGGAWRTITAVSAKEGGVWRTVQEVWAREGGTWRHSWINSDPKTYTWYANWGMTYRSSGAQRTSTYLYQGYYSSTYGQHQSLFGFDYSDIQSKTATRPVIDEITLRLSSEHFYKGDFNNPIGWTRHVGHSYSSAPSTCVPGTGLDWLWDDTFRGHEETWAGGWSGARDQTKTITLPNPVGDELRDDNARGLGLWSNTGTNQNYYCYMWGHAASTSLRPLLSITCDYS